MLKVSKNESNVFEYTQHPYFKVQYDTKEPNGRLPCITSLVKLG